MACRRVVMIMRDDPSLFFVVLGVVLMCLFLPDIVRWFTGR
jgi:hypothetical protein